MDNKPREFGTPETKERILDVAIEVLGQNPSAGIADIASSAGVVRRTVYGYFPSRSELVLALTRRAVTEMAAVLSEAAATHEAADDAWADFIGRLWPLVHRYRVLVVLRRGEFGQEIHALLQPVETALADLVGRGQERGEFGRHLAAEALGQVAWSAVFAIADNLSDEPQGARAATITSLFMLGVAEQRARDLAQAYTGHSD